MSELEIIKLVFGILLSAGAVVLFVLTFALYHKYLVQEKRCTQKIKGTVQRYTLFRYGGERSGTFLPVVFYHVDGKQYKVVGPEYRIYKEMVKTTPWSENNAQFTENDQPLTFCCQRLFLAVLKKLFHRREFDLTDRADIRQRYR